MSLLGMGSVTVPGRTDCNRAYRTSDGTDIGDAEVFSITLS